MKNKIPPASVERLPLYLSCLGDLSAEKSRVSSEKLSSLAKVNSAQVRRDLSYLGTLGTRGVGYEITTLKNRLEIELGLVKGWNTIIVGVGNLGSALAQYDGFREKGFGVVGLYDVDPKKISSQVAGLVIKSTEEIEEDCKKYKVAIGIIATPAEFAQETANSLIACGIQSILNFAPFRLQNIGNVNIRNVDLSQELQVLSYYLDSPPV